MTHIIFRCHNRQLLFKENEVKDYILLLWAKYKRRYGLKIFEFIIMDNHCHLLARARSAEALGHFMRNVNSQIARYVNKRNHRDSQVIRERYRSPLISSHDYALKTMQYIWLNRHKVNQSNPLFDPWCSVSWRHNPAIIGRIARSEKERHLLRTLLDYDDVIYEKNVRRFVLNLLNDALVRIREFVQGVYTHSHTIGDKASVEFRATILKAFRIEKNPWPGHISAFAVKLT